MTRVGTSSGGTNTVTPAHPAKPPKGVGQQQNGAAGDGTEQQMPVGDPQYET
jgi:hypothetical protein